MPLVSLSSSSDGCISHKDGVAKVRPFIFELVGVNDTDSQARTCIDASTQSEVDPPTRAS